MCIDPNHHYETNTLLTYSCINNSIELVEKHLKYSDIAANMYDPYLGETPLHIAIMMKNTTIAKLLIDHPKININMKNYYSETSLTFSASNDNEE